MQPEIALNHRSRQKREHSSFSHFADTITKGKYSWKDHNGAPIEEWSDIAYRVTFHVLGALGYGPSSPEFSIIHNLINERKFIPGGRYLAAAGRELHQVNNCILLRAEDSREGWSELLYKASMSLMTGAGIGVDYSAIRASGAPLARTGGEAGGPTGIMQMINECGRHIMAGGNRRSAIWAGLNWKHEDIDKFIRLKDWEQHIREIKESDFNFPATMDMTNISVQLDDDFFTAYHAPEHPDHPKAQAVYWNTVKRMARTAEPGFSIDVGKNSGETLRNPCVPGDVEVLTENGYEPIETLVDKEVRVWNGFEWSAVRPKVTGHNEGLVKVKFGNGKSLVCTKYHKFIISKDYLGTTETVEAQNLEPGMKLIKHEWPILQGGKDIEWAYTQGFASAEGMDEYRHFAVYGEKQKCIPFMHLRHYKKATNIDKTNVFPSFDILPKRFVPLNWSLQSRLEWLAGYLDGDGTVLKEGGIQAASISLDFLLDLQKMLTTLGIDSKVVDGAEAGFKSMPDGCGGHKDYYCNRGWRICIGAKQTQSLVGLGLKCHRLIINHSPNRDASRFVMIVDVSDAGVAETVYCFDEPLRHQGIFSGVLTSQCTEVSSRDDSDICNLGSINLARFDSIDEFAEAVKYATLFLLAGTVYSHIPYEGIRKVREANRRLGLGLMGIHEWLAQRGYRYEPNEELADWLGCYTYSTGHAQHWADKHNLSHPIKTRAIAPTGTIAIVAETTTGVEPIFCVAYKRRYLDKGKVWKYQYVIDPTARRLIEDYGVDPNDIEDAYSLSYNIERRLSMQAFVQEYVDHAISSTINTPYPITEVAEREDFGNLLIKYLPKLRGITVYPDGARGGQPLTAVGYEEALKHEGVVFEEDPERACLSGVCGA